MANDRRDPLGPGTAAAARPLVPRPGLDDIGMLLGDISRGTPIEVADGTVSAVEDITAGHKVALRDIPKGAPVRKYGEIIGVALADIPAGRHVHVHNLGIGRWEEARPSTSPTRTQPTGAAPTRDHFLGYSRVDGRAATRNYIDVVPTVNCSATVARMIARRVDDLHKGTRGLDGIIALPHDLGCGMGKALWGTTSCGGLCAGTSDMPTSQRPS